MDEEFVEEKVAHMKTGLKSNMSPVTLNIQRRLHSKMIQEKGQQRTWYELIS